MQQPFVQQPSIEPPPPPPVSNPQNPPLEQVIAPPAFFESLHPIVTENIATSGNPQLDVTAQFEYDFIGGSITEEFEELFKDTRNV